MLRETPEPWNATIYAGATFDVTKTIGTADLTGVDVRAQLRSSYTAGSALVTFGTADGSIVVGGTASTVRFMLSAASTSALGSALGYEQASLVFDAEAVEPGGVVSRIFQGIWSVSPEVTR